MGDCLVTGGAGFIGIELRAPRARPTPTTTVTVLDKLTYAGNPAVARRPARRARSTFVHGDICDADARRPAGRRPRRRRALRRRVAQRQLAGRPVAVRRRPTSSARSRCSRRCARHGARFHHISTDEVYGDLELDDPARFTEATPYNPSSPYSSTKAGSDLLVRAWVRSFGVAGHDQQLLEQLRPVPARREVHPASDHQRARRQPAQAVRRRAQRARLDPRRRPQRRRAADRRAGPGRRDLPRSAPTASTTTSRSSR